MKNKVFHIHRNKNYIIKYNIVQIFTDSNFVLFWEVSAKIVENRKKESASVGYERPKGHNTKIGSQ